jgi:MFS family permease
MTSNIQNINNNSNKNKNNKQQRNQSTTLSFHVQYHSINLLQSLTQLFSKECQKMTRFVSTTAMSTFFVFIAIIILPGSIAWTSYGRSSGRPNRNTNNISRLKPQQQQNPRQRITSLSSTTSIPEDDMNEKQKQKQSSSYSVSSAAAWWKDPRNRSVFGILSSSFLNLLGFTMVAGPLTPALGSHFGLEVGGLFGTLTSAYPLGMIIGIFMWPSLSDKVGRRPILALSLFGSGLGLIAQSLVIQRGGSLTQFLLARALTGIFAGSSPVGKAYLADIGAKDEKLPRYLALKDASSTMAFILGPAAGGLLFDIRRRMIDAGKDLTKTEILKTSGSLSFVIAVSAAASVLAAILAGSLVQESSTILGRLKTKTKKTGAQKEKDDYFETTINDDDQVELISCPLGRKLWSGVASVCLVSFLFNIGDSTFHAFYSAFLRNQGVSTRDIGLLFTSLACISFGISGTSASAILKSLGPVMTCASGLVRTITNQRKLIDCDFV